MESPLAQLKADLTDADRKALLGVMQTVAIAAGEDAAKGPPAFCVVTSGRLAVTLPTAAGRLELRELEAGSMFGEEEFVDGGAPFAEVIAREDATVLRLTRKDFDASFVGTYPGTGARLMLALGRTIAARLRAASAVRIENIDDDPAIEVVSALEALTSHELRPTQPIRCVSLHAYKGTGPESKTPQQNLNDARRVAAILGPLGHELQYGLGERMAIRTFNQGEAIVTQGQDPDGLYLLLDGQIDVEVSSVKVGDRPESVETKACLAPGSVFGQISFLLQVPRTATCRVKNTATLGMISGHLVDGLLRFAEQGRPGGIEGVEWIASQCAEDLRRVADNLKRAFEQAHSKSS